jgi:rhamnosyltransferase
MKNKILVLLASFNGEKFIEEQILSIKNQSSSNISILVSDDGSNDNTLSILSNLREKYNLDLKILSNKIKTGSFNGNFLNLFINADTQNYDFIALSDQDDIFLKNKFKESINITQCSDCVGVSSAVNTFGLSNKLLRQSGKISKFDFLFEGAGQGCTFVIKSKDFYLFKKFCLKNLELITKFYYHDWLIYLFFRTTGKKWFFYHKPLTKYRIHSENNTGEKYSIGGVLKRFLKILNGWYLGQIIYAIKIHNKLQKSNQIKISFFNLFILIVFHGRRKLSDRFLSIFCLLSYPFISR